MSDTSNFDSLLESGKHLNDNEIISVCRRCNFTDDFTRVIMTVEKFGPLPRLAVKTLFPDRFNCCLKHAIKMELLYVKNGCIGSVRLRTTDSERTVSANNTMQKLFAVLSEINKTSKIAHIEFGEEPNELVFITRNNVFKLILVRSGEEEIINQKYDNSNLEATEIVRYIPVVAFDEQIRKIKIRDIFMFAKLSYYPNAWTINWSEGEDDD